MLTATIIDSETCDNLGGRIYDGSISIDMIRPVSIKNFMMGQFWGNILYKLVFCILPVLFASVLILRIQFH
jgi:hypothetical protein